MAKPLHASCEVAGMNANVIKATLGGAVAVGVVVVCVRLFEGFGQDYEEAMKPKDYQVERETPAECLKRMDQRRAYLKNSMDRVRDNQWDLSYGKKETQNEAHREYLENYYDREMEEMETHTTKPTHETCNGGT